MTDIAWAGIAELNEAFASGALSPVEATQALINRADRLEPHLNAFVLRENDSALAAAKASEIRWKKKEPLGTLDGIPYGLKDIIDAAGLPTTCHSRLRLDAVARKDARVTQLMNESGAVRLGKLATHEFAIGGPAFDLPFPPARNPWNRDHHPGGSSSGAGTAIAAGMLPFALGSDTAGSIRNPAGACGIIGVKPTYGLVERDGVFPLAPSLDHIGPLCRSMADAALLLDILAEHPRRAAQYGVDLNKGVKGLKIGVVRGLIEGTDPQIQVALNSAIAALRDGGALIVDIALPDLSLMQAVSRVILQSEAWAVHGKDLRERSELYSNTTRRRLMPGAFLTAEDLTQAQRLRHRLIADVEAALTKHDLLLAPNSYDPICRIDDDAMLFHTYARQARAPFNLTGHPALAQPAGFCSAGLPISLQLVARYFDEVTLLRAGQSLEEALGLTRRHPPLNF